MMWHIRADQTHLRHINNIYRYLYLCRDCGIVQLLRPDTGRPYFVTLFVVTIKPTRLRPSFFPLLIVFKGLQNLAVSLTVQLFSFIIIFFELYWWRHGVCCVCPKINIFFKIVLKYFPKNNIYIFKNFPTKNIAWHWYSGQRARGWVASIEGGVLAWLAWMMRWHWEAVFRDFSWFQLVSTNTEVGGDSRFLLRSQRTQNIFADDS